ncbi:GNAT family N-acetyltransferase [Novosphingobium aquimarinum]|uniref:GNAT family N-acetyltransferase n=1 Tax=Novosphingobium aquimarinum TaxID=2682494 RepID=UPI0012EBB96A|nr:GNAT family N-acetyltransferase [Novosphingobium aquimarinum]
MQTSVHRFEEAAARGDHLRTARLRLRVPVTDDIAAILAIAGDFEIARRVARVPHPYTEVDARFFLDAIVPPDCVWAVTTGDPLAVIGMIGLHLDRETGKAELGYYFARDCWGRGYATEAASAVAAYGIGLLGPGTLMAGYFTDNPASGRVLAKIGFVETEIEMKECLATGAARPLVRMVLPA